MHEMNLMQMDSRGSRRRHQPRQSHPINVRVGVLLQAPNASQLAEASINASNPRDNQRWASLNWERHMSSKLVSAGLPPTPWNLGEHSLRVTAHHHGDPDSAGEQVDGRDTHAMRRFVKVTSLQPRLGPMHGGTLVVLDGDFDPVLQHTCHFGPNDAPGIVLSPGFVNSPRRVDLNANTSASLLQLHEALRGSLDGDVRLPSWSKRWSLAKLRNTVL